MAAVRKSVIYSMKDPEDMPHNNILGVVCGCVTLSGCLNQCNYYLLKTRYLRGISACTETSSGQWRMMMLGSTGRTAQWKETNACRILA